MSVEQIALGALAVTLLLALVAFVFQYGQVFSRVKTIAISLTTLTASVDALSARAEERYTDLGERLSRIEGAQSAGD